MQTCVYSLDGNKINVVKTMLRNNMGGWYIIIEQQQPNFNTLGVFKPRQAVVTTVWRFWNAEKKI